MPKAHESEQTTPNAERRRAKATATMTQTATRLKIARMDRVEALGATRARMDVIELAREFERLVSQVATGDLDTIADEMAQLGELAQPVDEKMTTLCRGAHAILDAFRDREPLAGSTDLARAAH